QQSRGACRNRQCLHPRLCPHLVVDHRPYLEVLRAVRAVPGVKKVFIRSGLRYDYLMADPRRREILTELCQHHISGQLKIAPEHCHPRVLKLMRKPSISVYERFRELYDRINQRLGKKQYVVPYLISGHPGSDLAAAIALAECVRDWGYHPEQIQDFIPTPGSLATAMYYSGIDPFSGQEVAVCRQQRQKAWQRALIQYRDPKNRQLVREALRAGRRPDLIGSGKKCLLHGTPGAMTGRPVRHRPAGCRKAAGGVARRSGQKRENRPGDKKPSRTGRQKL
ncbi:MAG: DUF3362 domain-containing protein, partial [Negativicutes bacterium]|nr:DUF3362 domain-containing protein [Negativicutes bacterium]